MEHITHKTALEKINSLLPFLNTEEKEIIKPIIENHKNQLKKHNKINNVFDMTSRERSMAIVWCRQVIRKSDRFLELSKKYNKHDELYNKDLDFLDQSPEYWAYYDTETFVSWTKIETYKANDEIISYIVSKNRSKESQSSLGRAIREIIREMILSHFYTLNNNIEEEAKQFYKEKLKEHETSK